jgi:hypothetical protein
MRDFFARDADEITHLLLSPLASFLPVGGSVLIGEALGARRNEARNERFPANAIAFPPCFALRTELLEATVLDLD